MSKPEKPPDERAEGTRPPLTPGLRLTPRPGLFKLLCLIYVLWMLALLAMYFWTVYPLRHPVGP